MSGQRRVGDGGIEIGRPFGRRSELREAVSPNIITILVSGYWRKSVEFFRRFLDGLRALQVG